MRFNIYLVVILLINILLNAFIIYILILSEVYWIIIFIAILMIFSIFLIFRINIKKHSFYLKIHRK